MIEVVVGDVATRPVDAVVNAANRELREGSGVCGAIFAAAGRAQLRGACEEVAPCPVGEVRVTPGFELIATWILHAVGPDLRTGIGEPEAERLLASTYRSVFSAASELGCRSVAVPAISTGVFGFDPALAAPIAVRVARDSGDAFELIELVAFDRATAATLLAALADCS